MSITLFGILVSLGFLISGYYLWLRAKDENLPEDEVFDIYIVSAVWALASSRAFEIAVRFNEFGWNIIRWFSVFSLPGLNSLAALLTFLIMVYLAGVKRQWEVWKTWDIFLPPLILWQAIISLLFSLPAAAVWILGFGILVWIEKEYRLWDWFKGRHSAAKTGLVSSIWLGLELSGISLVALQTKGMVFSGVLFAAGILAAAVSGYARSGRVLKSDLESLKRRFEFKPKRHKS
ncbi:prolipoprotein diacylglyceryl transferase [Candidatus Collierbacteria bacterium]|nr:prolipoprotein diacylglyceryl transferase [Candidatus Collierbacteria bacterium]